MIRFVLHVHLSTIHQFDLCYLSLSLSRMHTLFISPYFIFILLQQFSFRRFLPISLLSVIIVSYYLPISVKYPYPPIEFIDFEYLPL